MSAIRTEHPQNMYQDIEDNSVPSDVAEEMIRWAKGAISVGQMKDKAYVNLGGVSMGIAGSYCDMYFVQKYLGLRAEWVDLTEVLRRINLEIYDHDEYEKALSWIKANCKEGFDKNAGKDFPEIIKKSKTIPADKDWEFIAKFSIIVNDIMNGNPKLSEMGWHEESLGKNAIVGGFQGQRNWTDWLPNADFTEAIMASSFNGNGKKTPTAFASENDTLNGISMLRIPVNMHNVPEEKIYRLHAWEAFGNKDAQAADCADCKKYGHMYR